MTENTSDTADLSYYPLVVISDAHLGLKTESRDQLWMFLQDLHCDKLILNGDFLDGHIFNRDASRKLSDSDLAVIDAINALISRGTEVIYTPGNHDEALRDLDLHGKTIMGVTFMEEYEYTSPKGETFLIAHGDLFGASPVEAKRQQLPPTIEKVISAYETAFYKATQLDKKLRGRPRGNFNLASRLEAISSHVQSQVASISNLVGTDSRYPAPVPGLRKHIRGLFRSADMNLRFFRAGAIETAREKGFDGVVCGHNHVPEIGKTPDGITYANSGDWVLNFTALAMDRDGEWQLLRHMPRPAAAESLPPRHANTGAMVKAIRQIWPGIS